MSGKPETVPFLDIDLLKKEEKDPNKTKKEIYKLILSQCHDRIKKVNRTTEHRECFFEIPIFLPGYPVYDIQAANRYLVKHLNLNGVFAESASEGRVYISWQPADVNYEQYQYRAEKAVQTPNAYKLSVSPFASKKKSLKKSNVKSPFQNNHLFGRQGSQIELDEPDELDQKGYPTKTPGQMGTLPPHSISMSSPLTSHMPPSTLSSLYPLASPSYFPTSPSYPLTNPYLPPGSSYQPSNGPPNPQQWGFSSPPTQIFSGPKRNLPLRKLTQQRPPVYHPSVSAPPRPQPTFQSPTTHQPSRATHQPSHYQPTHHAITTPSNSPPASDYDLVSELRSETTRLTPSKSRPQSRTPQVRKIRPSSQKRTRHQPISRPRMSDQKPGHVARQRIEFSESDSEKFNVAPASDRQSNRPEIRPVTPAPKKKRRSKKGEPERPVQVSMLQYKGHFGDMIPVNTKKMEQVYPSEKKTEQPVWHPNLSDKIEKKTKARIARPPIFRPAHWP